MGLTEQTIQEIIEACASMSGLPYDGEPVDQLEHALQCAAIAQERRAEDAEFIIACLLHDIARAPAVAGIPYDGPGEHHGQTAARWLTPRVGERVAWLAAQHVPAKRFLVATDPGYGATLSEVSRRTLRAQGGAMDAGEISSFQSARDWREAVELRLIDDLGKVPGLRVPEVEHYRPQLSAVVSRTLAR